MKSVKLRLYLMDMPSGVAVKVCAVQPTTDTAATTASIDLNISFPLRVLFSQHYTSANITNSSLGREPIRWALLAGSCLVFADPHALLYRPRRTSGASLV